jgi:hypothetical protein
VYSDILPFEISFQKLRFTLSGSILQFYITVDSLSKHYIPRMECSLGELGESASHVIPDMVYKRKALSPSWREQEHQVYVCTHNARRRVQIVRFPIMQIFPRVFFYFSYSQVFLVFLSCILKLWSLNRPVQNNGWNELLNCNFWRSANKQEKWVILTWQLSVEP